MRLFALGIASAMLAMGGCSDTQPEKQSRLVIERLEPVSYDASGPPENEFGFWEAQESGLDLLGASAPSARSIAASTSAGVGAPTGVPSTEVQESEQVDQQIAYSYGFGFRIDGTDIAELQQAHIELCDAMGPKCRVMKSSQASSDSWDAYGELQLEVAASDAESLEASLAQAAESLDGELVSSVREGVDLTEQIIDSEARLQSRLILRDKLTEVLRRNRGSVDELIQAERAIADVSEQIDSTRSKLERFRNRVRFSEVKIEYEPGYGQSQVGFVQPVVTAFRSIGTTLGTTVGLLIYLLTALVPIVLLGLALRWVLHRFGKRIRFWKKPTPSE